MLRLPQKKSAISRPAALFWLGCALGVFAFLLLYGPTPLNPTNDTWLRGGFVEQDILQHYAGWLFYRSAPLRLPLCTPQSINWPQGISILYTDSIPLFALFFRLIEGLLPPVFQYFGWYTLLCFALQGGFAALLLELFLQNAPAALLGSLVFILSPVLVERAFRHTALGAQFLVLAALWYYFKGRQQNRFAYKGLFAINCLTIGLHPYFVPMTFAITLALLAEWAAGNRRWKAPVLFLAGNLAAALALGALLGLFTASGDGGSIVEYGYFGLNLNALWNPVSRWHTVWSRLLPVQNQTGGNYDAFCYLGLGALISCAAAVCCCFVRRQFAAVYRWVRGHLMLCAVCLALTLFAVSHRVTANGALLFTLPLPHALVRLATTFRSSGRMFWPVYYLLVLGGVLFWAWAAKRLAGARRGAVSGALLLLCAVQLWDISPALAQRHEMFSRYEPAFPSSLTSPFWQQAGERYRHILSLDELQQDPWHLALFAADHGMTTNDPFAARYDEAGLKAQRSAVIEQLRAGQPEADCLYLICREGLFLDLADRQPAGVFCAQLAGGWYVIAPGMDYLGDDALIFSDDFPLRLVETYTDDYWVNGVLARAPTEEWQDKAGRTLLFTDCAFTRRHLENARALRDDAGREYAVLAVDDRDEGWLMVTLDIPDASVLVGMDLEAVA